MTVQMSQQRRGKRWDFLTKFQKKKESNTPTKGKVIVFNNNE